LVFLQDGNTKMEYNCGVYAIYNTYTDKYYIGSSNNIYNRWTVHRHGLRTNQHHSSKLNHSWNKHGNKAFKFLLIQACSEEDLIDREQYWMDYFDAYANGYNMVQYAGRTEGWSPPPETRQKMKISAKIASNTKEQKELRSKRATEQHRTGNLDLKKNKHPMAKVTVEMALEILELIDKNIPRDQIKEIMGIGIATIQRIYMRQHWAVFDPTWKETGYTHHSKGKPPPNKGQKASDELRLKLKNVWNVQKRVYQAYWTAMRHVEYWGA